MINSLYLISYLILSSTAISYASPDLLAIGSKRLQPNVTSCGTSNLTFHSAVVIRKASSLYATLTGSQVVSAVGWGGKEIFIPVPDSGRTTAAPSRRCFSTSLQNIHSHIKVLSRAGGGNGFLHIDGFLEVILCIFPEHVIAFPSAWIGDLIVVQHFEWYVDSSYVHAVRIIAFLNGFVYWSC